MIEELGKDWDAPECLDYKTGIYSTDGLKRKQEKVTFDQTAVSQRRKILK